MSISFTELGHTIEGSISSYSETVSNTLITQLTPFFIVCVTIYICIKGYMFMSGRAENSIPDTVITLMKIGFISYLLVNTGNYVKYGINFIKSIEESLISVLPTTSSVSAVKPKDMWGVLDNLWTTMDSGTQALLQCYKALDGWDFGSCLIMVATIFIYMIMAAYLTFAALGVIIVATLSLEIVLGFGPLFCGLLMFPVTRSWFDGWIKSCMTYVFTMAIMAAVVTLTILLMSNQINDFADHVKIVSENLGEGEYGELLTNLFVLLIVSIGLTTLIKQVPSMAAGVVGGVALQAVGLGAMLSGIGGGAAKLVGGAALGGAIGAKLAGKEGAMNALSKTSSVFNGFGFAGRVADSMRTDKSDNNSDGMSKRAQRVIDAATK